MLQVFQRMGDNVYTELSGLASGLSQSGNGESVAPLARAYTQRYTYPIYTYPVSGLR